MQNRVKLVTAVLLMVQSILLTSCTKSKSSETVYSIDEKISKIEWKGSAPDLYHVGSFKLSGEIITGTNKEILTGDFTIPIASIDNFDLEGAVKNKLLDHLKSADFFNMVIYPNASFKLTKCESYNGNTGESVPGANYLITGNFSLIGQTHQITFPAKINTQNNRITVEAFLKLDRTKWGMLIYSDPEKPLYIFPDVDIKLDLEAAKK